MATDATGRIRFPFDMPRRFRPMLALLGVTPTTAFVDLTEERLLARFGPWVCQTSTGNIVDVRQTGPYRVLRAIGPRLSVTDRGLTFGTTTAGGVCLLFGEPVPGLDPLGLVKHPDLTVTVADRDGFEAAVRRTAGLPGSLER
jgi:hypothetical protein